MSTPTLELNIKASGVTEVKALKAALAELNGEVGKLSAFKNVSALDQLAQEMKGMRSDMQAFLVDLKKVMTDGIKGTFQQAQQQAVQGGKDLQKTFDDSMRALIQSIDKSTQERNIRLAQLNGKAGADAAKSGEQIGVNLAQGLEKSAPRVRLAYSTLLGGGGRASVTANGIGSFDALMAEAKKVEASVPALEASYGKAITALEKQTAAVMKAATVPAYLNAGVKWWEQILDDQDKAAILLEKEAAKSVQRLEKQTAAVMKAATQPAYLPAGPGWWQKVVDDEEKAASALLLAGQKLNASYGALSSKAQLGTQLRAALLLEEGVAAETVAKTYGTLATEAAVAAGSSAVLKAQLASLSTGVKNAHGTIMELGAGMKVTSQVFREASTVVGELAGGNLSRLRQSGFALANQMGALKLIFSTTGLAVAGVLAVVGLLATAFIKGEKETTAFKNAITLTNGYIGITKGASDELAQSLSEKMSISISTTKGALLDMAKSGKFTGESVGTLAEAILNYARATGETTDVAVKDFASMEQGVYAWAQKHNEQLHFMSEAQLNHVRLLELQGDKQKAMIEVGNALNDQLGKQKDNLGYIEKALLKAKNGWSDFWDAAYGLGREKTVEDRLAEIQGQLDKIRKTATNPNQRTGLGSNETVGSITAGLETQRSAFAQDKALADTAAATKAYSEQLQDEAIKTQKTLDAIETRTSRLVKETKAVNDATYAIQQHNKAWTDSHPGGDQTPYDAYTKQGYITDAQKAALLAAVHAQYNGAGTAQDGGAAAIRAQFKAEESELNTGFQDQQRIYTEQYRNLIISQGTYEAKSLQSADSYKQALFTQLAQAKAEEETQLAKDIAQIQSTNGASDKKQVLVEKRQNQFDTWLATQNAAINNLVAKASTVDDSIADNAIGKLNKLNVSVQEYLNKTEQTVKRDSDVAQARRALANATDEERARAEAEIKFEDMHSAYLEKLQTDYQTAQQAANDFLAVFGDFDSMSADQQQRFYALLDVVKGYGAALDKVTSKLKDLKQEAGDTAVADVINKQAQDIRNAEKELAKTTAKDFTDALLGGGKTALTKLKDDIKQMFFSPIRITVQALIKPYTEALGNYAMNSLGLGPNGTASGGGFNFSNLFGGNTGGSNWSLSNVGTSGQGISGFLGFGNSLSTAGATGAGAPASGAAELVGNAASNGAMSGISSALPYIGALYAASQGQYGQAAGMAIGTAILPGIGTVIGAAIGSIVDSLSKSHGPKDEGYYNYSSAVPNTEASGAKQIADAINSSYATVATQLGVSNAAMNAGVFFSKDPNGTAQTQLDVTAGNYSRGALYGGTENVGRSDAEFTAAITQATEQAIITGLLSSDLDQKFKDYLSAVDIKSSADVLSQKITDVLNVKRILDSFKLLGSSFSYLQTASFDTVKALIDTAGGFDALNSKLGNFYNNYYTQSEKQQLLQDQLTEQFAKLNIVMPKTRAEFKSLVLAQDLTTDAGRTMFNALLNLSDAFAQLTSSSDNLASATKSQAQLDQDVATAKSALQTAYDNEADRLTQVRDRMQSFSDKLGTFLQELTTGDLAGLTPQQQYAAAKQDFEKYAQELNSSDPTIRDDALTNIDAAGKAFLEASRVMFGASDGYYGDLSEVKTAVQQAKDIAGAGVDVANLQLTTLNNMVVGLVQLKDTTAGGLTALYNVSGSGFGAVVSAIQALDGAISASTSTATGGGAPSTDAATTAISSYYNQYLGRSPETDGLNYWLNLYNSGVSLSTIEQGIKGSPEATQHNGGVPLRAGIDSVPYDNFPATLHKNEAVLTAAANEKRQRQLQDQDEVIRELSTRLMSLEKTVADGLDNVVASNFAAADAAAEKTVDGHEKALSKSGWSTKTRDGAKLK